MTVIEATEAFIAYCRSERRLSANTVAAYRQDAKEFVSFFEGRQADALSGCDLAGYADHLLGHRSLAPATVKRRLASVRSMYGWLARSARLPASPFSGAEIRIRIPDRLPRCLGDADMASLAKAARLEGGLAGVWTMLLFATGMRVGELASLCLEDVDVERGTMRIVGKGDRERVVFLPPGPDGGSFQMFVRERKLAGHARFLFSGPQGCAPRTATIRAAVKGLARRAGIQRAVTPHALRHTAATSLLEAGVDIRMVQRLLGHRSIVTTQMYTHVSDSALGAAVRAADICGRLGREPARVHP